MRGTNLRMTRVKDEASPEKLAFMGFFLKRSANGACREKLRHILRNSCRVVAGLVPAIHALF
jgi:hypothetical protein